MDIKLRFVWGESRKRHSAGIHPNPEGSGTLWTRPAKQSAHSETKPAFPAKEPGRTKLPR